ncbi:30S ribosomal protein S4 [endosymbiont of Pachyrhynchus infernalis]|uniref:30S ribosomal protein S4 n=1 Tax=endosymbiont of Pachyrhynchus infernalis TaxID=1971488 RepID=UPI000DC6FB04|nr:30S ribosomal protein S4 [endosymbiont of Pachyrhynchus infernalis]BBA84855.1 30S ribosomal protein S4 [endosymbiont of Pachyrhynchus infernalis]
MSKYIGPKLKLSRRDNFDLSLKSGCKLIESKCKFNKIPGENFSKKYKYSDYGIRLREKQKLKRIYGILEKQFLNYYKKSINKKENTGNYLIKLLESRLDNIVYRMGFASTRRESRQIINHKLVLVNDKIINIPSYHVTPNTIIRLHKKLLNNPKIIFSINLFKNKEKLDWINVNINNLSGEFLYTPNRLDILKDINENLIIELYSR